ncbi:hypothetical protein HPP92_021208 [Vanilla planifolia]|uniref:Uncharacterized protein n=1 Tax=Vanilla planifolia TaxID=51239 RepID=A0A835Q7I9_VANPL|nr:hypothetical protein HPP92_021208 [Vanilla planifolia]
MHNKRPTAKGQHQNHPNSQLHISVFRNIKSKTRDRMQTISRKGLHAANRRVLNEMVEKYVNCLLGLDFRSEDLSRNIQVQSGKGIALFRRWAKIFDDPSA